MLSTCVLLYVAGHETTVNLIGNGLLALLRHPAELERLRAQPDLLPTAVEELLRYDAPVQRTVRIAHEDVEFGGQPIDKGSLIVPVIGAANRDPAHFPDPDRLDIGRAREPARRASATASTSAWGRRWRGWRARSRSPACSGASRTWPF